jgi:hypothetical protein
MNRSRQFLALLAGSIGAAATIFGAPIAAADENGGCQVVGAGDGGQATDCVTPGNAQLNSTPNNLGIQGAMVDEAGAMFGGFGFR